jgi:replication factor C subunit 1
MTRTGPALSSQLWTTKYAPKTLKEICGNKGSVEKLGQWLEQWYVLCALSHDRQVLIFYPRPKSYKEGFKKPGKDGMGQFRAILISGPPGIGKTTSAHLVAKLKGYSPIELNASDSRSKKLVQVSITIH